MTIEQFYTIDWHRGRSAPCDALLAKNVVKLENGKEYLCKGTKGHGRYLLLYSLEYDANFIADHNIVTEQVSDYAEPEEVYLKYKVSVPRETGEMKGVRNKQLPKQNVRQSARKDSA